MKYIRTDDGVYELKIDEQLKSSNISNYYFYKLNDRVNICIDKDSLNKYEQADTIEELCDEIVFICGDDVTLNYELITIEQYEKYYKGEDCCCRCAIWTKRGLKFVSEMNTKTGEMELL